MGMLDRGARTGLLVGALASFLALDVAFLVSLIGLPFTPLALGQALIEVMPGSISIPLIEALQFWAKGLLVIGVVALFIVAGAAAGALALTASRRDRTVVAAVAAPWLLAITLAQLFAAAKIDFATSLIDAAVGVLVQLAILAVLAPAVLVTGTAPAPARRRALLGGAALAALAALGALPLSRVLSVGSAIGNVPFTPRRLVQAATVAPGDPVLDAVAGLASRVTPTDDHYVVDTTLVKPRVDIATWRLDVNGAVDHPFTLTYEELLDMESVEDVRTLECISNPIGGDIISTAVWTGVRLQDLLQRAGPRSNAFDVVFTSVDGYSDSFRIAKAMEPDTVLAYLMNGRTLPQEHGYPVRVLVPNIYGMKNVKWLRTINVATYDFIGYWQEQGWSDSAVVNTNTRIDVPGRNVRWSGGPVVVAGIAFAGARGISKVEVSFDSAKTWNAATLEDPPGKLTWRRWSVRWTPPATGAFDIYARSTDGQGNMETPEPREPYPDGATGYHSVRVFVQG